MNKTILLTGASGGIGLNLIKPLSDAGYDLALHYHEKIEPLAEKLDEVKPKTKVACFKADLSVEADVITLFNGIKDFCGGVDIVINNAGISFSSMSWKMKLEDWMHTLNTNLTTAFLTTKHALPYMREQEWGRIINVSSVVAQTGVAGASAYAASKSALYGFTKSVAKEVANKNITINTLSYGYMDAGMIDTLTPEMRDYTLAQIPMKKFGPVENIASTLLLLASEESNYITGQNIPINGGLA
jgi:NAD(P)-dependent dehydrogenase (short-subunit alcohol dehydrogenase family)